MKDESKALALYRLAATHHDSGNPEEYALRVLHAERTGNCYNNGTHGVIRNNILAMAFVPEVAESNCNAARMNCVKHYSNGTGGFQKGFILGIKYLRAAAVQEYETASDLIQDLIQAVVYERRACMACGKSNATRKCARCCTNRYCTANYQMVAWKHPTASHKLQCQGAHSPRGNQDISPFTYRACYSGASLESSFTAGRKDFTAG
jgi:TPR repeat protein